MVTIDQLAVTVRVEGDSEADEAAFVELFDKYIEIWRQEMALVATRERRSCKARSLGDRHVGFDRGTF